MGVFRLYTEVAAYLSANPSALASQSVETIAAVYTPYAYIGNRKSLQQVVLREAQRLHTCPHAPSGQSLDDIAAWWFGRGQWQTDSGAFPDFVLAWEETGAVGDGALIELKDSGGKAIASFNSTLPSARKSIDKLTPLVREAIARYEQCFSTLGPNERDCFYLVRTHKQKPAECRLSLVHGTFFETLPMSELLKEMWKQLFNQANVPDQLQPPVIEYLAQLDRAEIAQTRQIKQASVKPRLRIMSEIHTEGNPHTYPEIPPRSVNLILKPPVGVASEQFTEWIVDQFQRDKVPAATIQPCLLRINQSLQAMVKSITHLRNGTHLVVQVLVPLPYGRI